MRRVYVCMYVQHLSANDEVRVETRKYAFARSRVVYNVTRCCVKARKSEIFYFSSLLPRSLSPLGRRGGGSPLSRDSSKCTYVRYRRYTFTTHLAPRRRSALVRTYVSTYVSRQRQSESIRNSCDQFNSWVRHRGKLTQRVK